MEYIEAFICTGVLVNTLFLNTVAYHLEKTTHVYNLPPVDYTLADGVITDVTYQLFTNKSNSGIYITNNSAVRYLNLDIPTKIIIHGWLSNETTYWYQPYREECFKKGDYNVIYIDWSKAGAKDFYISAANCKPIGAFIGDFIIGAKLKLSNVHIVGHSLGSHVAGFIGKRIFEATGKKIARITCTDPAGPAFEHPEISESQRVAHSDAEFVDVIHTDIGHYGFIKPIGHVDFYPNGGVLQPGCPSYEEDDNCSHTRSNWYFIESVNSSKFLAMPCNSWERYIAKECGDKEKIVFGENVPKTARGVYYFETNSTPPFVLEGR